MTKLLVGGLSTKIARVRQELRALVYLSSIDLSTRTLRFLTGHLTARRKEIGTRRRLPAAWQALQLDPAADGLRAYAARTRESADQLAAVLEDIAANGLPAVEDPALQHSQEPGLRPAVIQILAPGDQPARAHAPLLDASSPGDGDTDTFVIVDQFEEVYTLCQDPAERTRFIDLLLAARQPASRLRVLIAVRADFYGRCAEHHALADALRDANCWSLR